MTSFFRFRSRALDDDALAVLRVEGQERISGAYRFELDLLSREPEIDFSAVLRSPAKLEIVPAVTGKTVGEPKPIHGRIAVFEERDRVAGGVRYRAVLVPRIWKLTLTHQSRIFLDRTAPQLIEDVLFGAGFTEQDFELRLTARDRGPYASREYVVQYEESDFDFLSRWLEHEGIFYFFEQRESADKVVFADSVEAYGSGPSLRFRHRESEPDDWSREESIGRFVCRAEPVPARVILKDYDWSHPDVDLQCSAEVAPDGDGVVYEYNNHYRTKADGETLAAIRAEEIRCRARVYTGAGDCRSFRAGSTWELWDHFRGGFNRKYVLTEVRHQGRQDLTPGSLNVQGAAYANEFTCLEGDRIFRPPRATPWPAIKGVMHAKVDGELDGKYAEVDEEGRYTVRLPLDLSDRPAGKASRRVRMAQPYAGESHGMHFPLHPGTEVILTHIDGDPDRPIITGAVPNARTGNVVDSNNHTAAGIHTAGGNQIAMQDAEGHQRIFLKAGSGKSAVVVGAGSADRIDVSSPWTTVTGGLGSLYSALMNNMTGVLSASVTAGFPLLQVPLWLLRTTVDIVDQTIVSPKLKEADWPAGLAPVTAGLFALSGKLISALVTFLYIKPTIEALLMNNALAAPAAIDNDRWYAVFQKASAKFKSLITGTGAAGYGAYFVRCGGGSRMQVSSRGEGVAVGSEKGTLVLVGNNITMNSPNDVNISGENVHVFTRTSSLLVGEYGTTTAYKKETITLDGHGVEAFSSTSIFLGSGTSSKMKAPGTTTYLQLEAGKKAILSSKTQVGLAAGASQISVKDDGIVLSAGDSRLHLQKNGTVTIVGKEIKLCGDDLHVGDGDSDLWLQGKDMTVVATGGFSVSSGSISTINAGSFPSGGPVGPLASRALTTARIPILVF